MTFKQATVGTTLFEYFVIEEENGNTTIHLIDLDIGMSITNNCERCFERVVDSIQKLEAYRNGEFQPKFTYTDSGGDNNIVTFNPRTFCNPRWQVMRKH